MSSRQFNRTTTYVRVRAIAVAGVLMLSGCAYFHPAFMTNASLRQVPAEQGVLVCERTSLRKADCRRVSRAELREFLESQTQHF